MKLNVICQICGRTKTIDTDKQVKQDHPGWDNYCLGDFEIDGVPPWYDTHEIWICDKCHKEALDHYETEKDETGEEYEIPDYDGEKLSEMIRVSCGIEEEEK